MSLFIESIRVEPDDSVPLLTYHQARMDRALTDLQPSLRQSIINQLPSQLSDLLAQSTAQGIRKYRILYTAEGIQEATLTQYQIRPITSLSLAPITFAYEHKYADRIEINACYHTYPHTDDVIMTRSGLLTDTSYGNIAMLREGTWYTPESPLLHGCRRQYLIDNGLVEPKKIRIEDVNSYSYLMIFNAMIPFGRLLIPTRHLHY